MKIVIIVQARMASTRLPGKVLREVLGKPLLEYQIQQLRQIPQASEVVVATTANALDDAVEALCKKLDCCVFRGSETDVLKRYYEAAHAYDAEVIVRVTGDCPLIDPQVASRVIQFYLRRQASCDYASNTIERTYPRGMDTEVFPLWALEEAFREARMPGQREHVTPFFYTQPERYRLGSVTHSANLSVYRWTVDTEGDFQLVRRILEALAGSSPLTLANILKVVNNYPEWAQLNAGVKQKEWRGE